MKLFSYPIQLISKPLSKKRCALLAGIFLAFFSLSCLAADNSALNVFSSAAGANGGQNYSLSLQTLILLTALSFLPTVLLMMTSFTRIIIVLSLLRQAIGAQSSPPNQILLGLALFLTFFIMNPVLDRIYGEAYKPLTENKITMQQALDRGTTPIKEFMLKQTREADLAMFLNMTNKKVATAKDIPLSVLVPSFMTSELKTGFQIGFSIFIPFLVIDMVVASVLMAMGMMMLPPSIVSLPFKLMLFVLVDGWQLLLGSLANSFLQ
ncbi:flagellar type III secretion system pore protein FliP [Polynucleobacter paneuropaeus]|jgi:flagellar biosynthetic protein FliP|nr:flagellar type III secretion system pore protein FliP [Polynucleobacter paneuropaeus]QWD04652.1 flagellar type III secretion system pore protein FliP [Polynucleobacter paneuropaeus]QWD46686.1 flagellar type III secretion system pore protein FliP [Polynucleobacter paneuropaeus]